MTSFALTGGHGLALVEKWYIDTLLDDGGVLIVYLLWMRNAGIASAEVRAELHTAEGSVHKGRARAPRVAGGERLDFGSARLEGEQLVWDTPGLSGSLTMTPRHPAVQLCDPVFDDGRQCVRWTVEVPDADVRGHVRLPGMERAIRGRGYRDRVYCNVIPWRFPMRSLRWGRAAAGRHASIWFAARTTDGAVSARWDDGVGGGGEAPPTARGARLLLDERLAETSSPPLAPLRAFARWLLSDPHQRRWTAETSISGASGHAIYEEVLWHHRARHAC